MGYLGDNQHLWQEWDACLLIENAEEKLPILVDQGEADNFLEEQLKPEALELVCEKMSYPLQLNRRSGYDHSYYFIATFIDSHLEYHAKALGLLS